LQRRRSVGARRAGRRFCSYERGCPEHRHPGGMVDQGPLGNSELTTA
jgi:hypothetical protein